MARESSKFVMEHDLDMTYICRQATGTVMIMKADLADLYRSYIACLNKQDWSRLDRFVDEDVRHNGRRLGLQGYRAMLEQDFQDIPDLSFNIELLMSDPPYIASRLRFDCTPTGQFLGLAVNGKKIAFTENVFYECREERISKVWSIIDKAQIEVQILV